MNLNLNEIVQLSYELNGIKKDDKVVLNGLLAQKISLKTKVYLQRLNKVVAEELKVFEDTRKELLLKYGIQEGESVSIPTENIESFKVEFDQLLRVNKNIDVDSLWSDDLSLKDFEAIETDEFYPVFFKFIDK